MIKREKYLKNIRPFYDIDLIKVITGIRRCGKSIILMQIIEELKEKGIKENQIIYINFEFIDYIDITEAKALTNYIEKQFTTNEKYYCLAFKWIKYLSRNFPQHCWKQESLFLRK